MSSFRHTTKYEFNTPEKVVRPDGVTHTHLKSTTPPTIEPTKFSTSRHTNNVYMEVDRSSHVVPQYRHQSFDNQHESLLNAYELKINLLKNYLHSSEDIEREKIVDIFGFQYPCCKRQSAESKIVLKELSSKVKDLIRENNRLKESREYVFTSKTQKNEDTLLLAQNEKLRSMIEEYRRSEGSSLEKLQSQNFQLKKQNEALRMELRQKNLSVSSRSQSYSSQDMSLAKKELTKQMFQFSQTLDMKNKQNIDKINQMEGRVNMIGSKLRDYEKQRQIKVQSTIRKSFALSQSMIRPVGDAGIDGDHDDIPRVKQAEFFSVVRPTRVQGNESVIIKENPSSVNENMYKQKIAMQQMKIRNLMEENAFLKDQISQLNGKINGKVERIIGLQELLGKIENDKQNFIQKTTVVNPELEEEVKIIKETLTSCNISNFQTFFKEFNQIIRQRNEMNKHLQGISVHKTSSLRNKEQKSLISQKMNDLMEQNKRLLHKIGELESEAQRYHEQVISSEIEKLNSIKLSAQASPSGKQAVQWQYKVKSCIQNSVNRLEILEKKIAEKKISTVTEFDRRLIHDRQ